MSLDYNKYLIEHKSNVIKGYEWMCEYTPSIISKVFNKPFLKRQIYSKHDESKSRDDEYAAYDAYFYGGNKSFEVVEKFNKAWLLHIHRNPHHWQYWVLLEDDPNTGESCILIDMPYEYIIEMICDWWSFSWASGNLFEIFKWYDEHKNTMKLSIETELEVEHILNTIKKALEKIENSNLEA